MQMPCARWRRTCPSGGGLPTNVDEAVSNFGGLNVLANMHGISDFSDTNILAVSEEVFTHVGGEYEGLFLLCKAAIPEMQKAGKGAIVNMSSGAALGGAAEPRTRPARGRKCAHTGDRLPVRGREHPLQLRLSGADRHADDASIVREAGDDEPANRAGAGYRASGSPKRSRGW